METNNTCDVITASTPRLAYVLMVAPTANTKLNGRSRSTILKSEETYIKKNRNISTHTVHDKILQLIPT